MKPPRRPPSRTAKGAVKTRAIASTPVRQPVRQGGGHLRPDAARKDRTNAPASAPRTGMQLHTIDGARKYLTAGEREGFLREADRTVRTLCMTLAHAGCRLSEALALTVDRVDLAAGVLAFESLKKRRTGIFRAARLARRARPGARHPRGPNPLRQGPWRPALAKVADDRVAGGACGDASRRARGCASLAQRGCGTASGWPPSPPASHSTWCRNGSVMPSSAPRQSTPVPSARRSRASPPGCGSKLQQGEPERH